MEKTKMSITIKALHTMKEMQAAVALQKVYWGEDTESLVPAHMLFSLANYGGHVLGAYDGDRLVGVQVGFLGTSSEGGERPAMANLLIMSKRLVVLPEYRGQGVGYRLKLAQRDVAIRQGVRLVTWTFNPLMAANAHLNLRKLGGICQRYLVDYFGVEDVNDVLSADRLVVDWWVTHRRVDERLNGTRRDLTLDQYLQANAVIVNPACPDEAGLLAPALSGEMPTQTFALVEIPADFAVIEKQNPELAQQWRMHIRSVLRPLLAEQYVVTDFLRGPVDGRERVFYLCARDGGGVHFSLN